MSPERKGWIISQKIPSAKQSNSNRIQSSRKPRASYTGGNTDLGFRRSLRLLSKDNLGV